MLQMATAPERLFDLIASEGDLQRLVDEAREEDLYLEFKRKTDARDGVLGDSDRKNFSKTLSGFANADGGVLIFGIETRPNHAGIDCAHALAPITDAEGFRRRVMDSVANTTQSVVDGVRIEVIPAAGGGGYVRCLIPASDKPPHRAMLAEREYWRRISNGHRRMEHYELVDVFGRRLRPSLRVGAQLRPRPGDDPFEELNLYFLNEGRGVARHAGLLCMMSDVRLEQTSGVSNQSSINGGRPTVTWYSPQEVIHPNGIYRSLGQATFRRDGKGAPLTLHLTWYAEEMDTRRVDLVVRPGDIVTTGS